MRPGQDDDFAPQFVFNVQCECNQCKKMIDSQEATDCATCKKTYCRSCIDSDRCAACQMQVRTSRHTPDLNNAHNHFAAVIDYSVSEGGSPIPRPEVQLFEIQNVFRTPWLLGEASHATSHGAATTTSASSQSYNNVASVVGYTPTAYSKDLVAYSIEFFLRQFGMPNFSLNDSSTTHDEQHFVNHLFAHKVVQRLCLAENIMTAKWMPKAYVCCIEVSNESQTQLRNQLSAQLQAIYAKASRFLSPSQQWIFKIHGKCGEGNLFIDPCNSTDFVDKIVEFMQSHSGYWVCLIEEVQNAGGFSADGISKTYRSVVYYNALTDEFKAQVIYCYLTQGSVDSHKSQAWKYYPAKLSGFYDRPAQEKTELQYTECERYLNLQQHQPALYDVFKTLCRHATQSRERLWENLVKVFLPVYVDRPLNAKLQFHDYETVEMIQAMYQMLEIRFYR